MAVVGQTIRSISSETLAYNSVCFHRQARMPNLLVHQENFHPNVCTKYFRMRSLLCCLPLHMAGYFKLLQFYFGENVGQLMC